jgi:hypothetical protein
MTGWNRLNLSKNSDIPIVGVIQDSSVETGSFKAGEPKGAVVMAAGDGTVPKVAADFEEPESRTGLFRPRCCRGRL